MKRLAAIAAFASALMIGSASAQYYDDEDVACEMYEHNSFGGRALPMRPDQAVSFRGGQFWNDRVSSARVARGCTLTVYEHTRMQGDAEEFSRNIRALGDWNDEISSAECYCDDE
ncbi:peptidase inhibitor family I36 protein [Aminobacter sp. AP02]|uniref:peptidase inhibitor family I36 protein n=1 Tax=Aminobacter sp. AP02 TaxID=2135737 RepID=UPI000D6CCF6F|nr:peptidase inhibitor family I36 protein [Aminobacter sp. AP02]PWK69107.1 beta/gamma crystallin [Aminobacter sp. AP02]